MSKNSKVCLHYINGEWMDASGAGESEVLNPSTGETIGVVPLGGAVEVDTAVRAANAAFPGWANTPAIDRARLMFRYHALLEKHFDQITRMISREHGKTLGESKGDLFRGLEMVELACGAPMLLMGDMLPNIARGIDGECVRHPLGVCAGITPFNFPAMIPLWMFPLALVSGNTFVLKPSERVPMTATKLVELLVEAGLPKGVLNLVHGAKDASSALLQHPLIKAVSFVGSTPVARHVHQTASAAGKRVQANGGAKNHIVVLPDADPQKTIEGILNAAFGCAGERCMSGSTLVTVGNRGKHFMDQLIEAARRMTVGRTDVEKQPDMGALITKVHRDRVCALITDAEQQGARMLLDGRAIRVPDAPGGFYVGPTIIEDVRQNMKIVQEEVFGPELNVIHAATLDEAIDVSNSPIFGNGASIFTRSGMAARAFKEKVRAGMIGVNIGVPASMMMFPFSGWNASFFGDLHMQGKSGIQFYTQPKTITTRWFAEEEGDIWRQS